MVLKKREIEVSLQQEQQLIQNGAIKEDNPLDLSEGFRSLCEACRRGDLKSCQEALNHGVNINARDAFDYTPLILVRGILVCPRDVPKADMASQGKSLWPLRSRTTPPGIRCSVRERHFSRRTLLVQCSQ